MVTVSMFLNVTFVSSFYARVVFLSLQTSLGLAFQDLEKLYRTPPKLDFILIFALKIGQKCDYLFHYSIWWFLIN